jgi:hypothetical protein
LVNRKRALSSEYRFAFSILPIIAYSILLSPFYREGFKKARLHTAHLSNSQPEKFLYILV